MATEEEIAELRELIAQLPPEVRAEIRQQYRVRAQAPGIIPQTGNIFERAAIAGIGVPSAQTSEQAASNLATGVEMLAVGTGIPAAASGIASAAALGRTGLATYARGKAKRAAVGAVVGGALGESDLPIVGGRGFTEGAQLGALWGVGQGGKGALWKHGKSKKIVTGIVDRLLGAADEATPAISKAASRTMKRLPRETLTQMPSRATVGSVTSSGPARMSAPAPTARTAAPLEGGVINMEPTKSLAAQGGGRTAVSAAKGVSKAFLEFVRKEGPKFKRNERVWFVKDASGVPLQTFESGAAATGWTKRAVNRGKGYTTDFFENLWSK